VTYEAGYYSGEDRRDLIEEMRHAADWCDQQLSTIEAQVPPLAYPAWDPAFRDRKPRGG